MQTLFQQPMLALPYRWFHEFGGAERMDLCEDSTLGRICKSAPTVCVNFMDEWIVRTDIARSGGFHEFGGAERMDLCEDSTLGRICKSAPTVRINFMDEWIVRTDTARSGGFHEFGGASDCSCSERYFRADMQIRPYRLHKFYG